MSLTLVHLVRKSNGEAPFDAFTDAYEDRRPGVEHDLVLAFKGFSPEESDYYANDWGGRVLCLPDRGFDLGTYRLAALELKAEYVCFLNSWSRPLVSGWLKMLYDAARAPGVGIAGATGSHEAACGMPFPNDHVRTNAFCMRRELFLECVPKEPELKEDACALEAGILSVTRQMRAHGLFARVVDSAGISWPIGIARESCAFRWGDQGKLLVADNRTDHFQHAKPEDRAWLQRLAWGVTEE